MTKALPFTDVSLARAIKGVERAGLVYFVEIGKHIKIGFTTNLPQRLKAFLTSSADVCLLVAIPGDRSLEKALHQKLADCRIERELFRREWRVLTFIDRFERNGIDAALQFLDETDPAAVARHKVEERERRVAAARQSRAEKDAYFASLVLDRKNRLGW